MSDQKLISWSIKKGIEKTRDQKVWKQVKDWVQI